MIIPHSACSVSVCVAVYPNGDFAWLYHFPLNHVCPVFLDKRSKSSGFFKDSLHSLVALHCRALLSFSG